MDLTWLFGRATTAFHHSTATLNIPLKHDRKSAPPKFIPLSDLVKDVTPPCNLSPFVPGGHMQTVMAALLKKETDVYYRRHIFEQEDERYAGAFAVDFLCREPVTQGKGDEGLPAHTRYFSDDEWDVVDAGSADEKPLLVVLHGLSGGSHELYLREVLLPLSKTEKGQAEWEIAVVMARACGWSELTSGRLFNARATWDVRQLVKWLRGKYPNRRIFGLGFSLGGNIITNYIGEEGDSCEFDAAVVCSNPFDLSAGNLALQRSWIGREIYSKQMCAAVQKLYRRNMATLAENPRVFPERVLNATYLHEFDRELQAPTWGYPTEGAYYKDASSTDALVATRIPTLAIHALDDPIVPGEALPVEEVKMTEFGVLVTTTMGGHLGWFEFGGGRWFVKPVVGFLRQMADNVDLKALMSMRKGRGDPSIWRETDISRYRPLQRKLVWK